MSKPRRAEAAVKSGSVNRSHSLEDLVAGLRDDVQLRVRRSHCDKTEPENRLFPLGLECAECPIPQPFLECHAELRHTLITSSISCDGACSLASFCAAITVLSASEIRNAMSFASSPRFSTIFASSFGSVSLYSSGNLKVGEVERQVLSCAPRITKCGQRAGVEDRNDAVNALGLTRVPELNQDVRIRRPLEGLTVSFGVPSDETEVGQEEVAFVNLLAGFSSATIGDPGMSFVSWSSSKGGASSMAASAFSILIASSAASWMKLRFSLVEVSLCQA